MWPPWGKGASAPASPRHPSFSFPTFKDVGSLVRDDSPSPPSSAAARSSSAIARRASVFHRVRIASSALRAWRSSPHAAAEKRIVIYFTSLRVVRRTFDDCRAVRAILRGFRVAVDERDVSMDSGFVSELRSLLGLKDKRVPDLPVVFIGGRCIGGADEIRQMHEAGELKRLVDGVPLAPPATCGGCGGVRFVLCEGCSGSRRLYSEKSGVFRTCNACNENGLVRCSDCA